jgi:hypothetical protein
MSERFEISKPGDIVDLMAHCGATGNIVAKRKIAVSFPNDKSLRDFLAVMHALATFEYKATPDNDKQLTIFIESNTFDYGGP